MRLDPIRMRKQPAVVGHEVIKDMHDYMMPGKGKAFSIWDYGIELHSTSAIWVKYGESASSFVHEQNTAKTRTRCILKPLDMTCHYPSSHLHGRGRFDHKSIRCQRWLFCKSTQLFLSLSTSLTSPNKEGG